MYIICPLTNTFPIADSRPLITTQEFKKPIEVILLEYIHNTKFNYFQL